MYFDVILDAIFPRLCVMCGEKILEGVICKPCEFTIPVHDTFFCPRCGIRSPEVPYCHHDLDYVLGAAAPYSAPALQSLVLALKFRSVKEAAIPLALLLTNYSKKLKMDLSRRTVIPVPLSRERERIRGFNQAAEIARIFARENSLKFDPTFLIRKIHRKAQSETSDLVERKNNILGCYAIATKKDPPRAVILIDDVTTSGTTLSEAARTLRESGVRNIFALVAAKA